MTSSGEAGMLFADSPVLGAVDALKLRLRDAAVLYCDNDPFVGPREPQRIASLRQQLRSVGSI